MLSGGANRTPKSQRRRLLTSHRATPELQWDSVSAWSTWVYGFTFGPLVVEIVIYEIVKRQVAPADLEDALVILLTWFLVIGLALAGLGQFMQTLAHRWKSVTGQRCQTVGSLIGLGGWAIGLLAGVAFPIVDNGVPKNIDPTTIVFTIALVLPTAIWVMVAFVRSLWLWRRECGSQRNMSA